MTDRPDLRLEHRRRALQPTASERLAILFLAGTALGLAALAAFAGGSPVVAAGFLAAGAVMGLGAFRDNRFVAALGAAAAGLNPGWGFLFLLGAPFLLLALLLAFRARRDFDTPAV